MTCGAALCCRDRHPQLATGDALCHPVREVQLGSLHADNDNSSARRRVGPTCVLTLPAGPIYAIASRFDSLPSLTGNVVWVQALL